MINTSRITGLSLLPVIIWIFEEPEELDVIESIWNWNICLKKQRFFCKIVKTLNRNYSRTTMIQDKLIVAKLKNFLWGIELTWSRYLNRSQKISVSSQILKNRISFPIGAKTGERVNKFVVATATPYSQSQRHNYNTIYYNKKTRTRTKLLLNHMYILNLMGK